MDRSARLTPAPRRGARPLRRATTVAAISFGTVLAVAASAAAAVPNQVIGHRGGTDFGPENALDTFKHAVAVGADAIEFDVRFTKDLVAVLSHDETVDRMTNCSGTVASFTLSSLQKCDINVRSGAPRQAIPTLDATLAVLAPSSVKIYVHVKEGSATQSKAIVAALNKYKLNTTSGITNRTVVFADSGSASFLTNLKAAGAQRMGTIFNSSSGWSANYPVIIAYNTPVTRKLVAAAQAKHKFVIAVEDHPVTASQVSALGLDGFMANDLDGFLIRIGRLEDPAVTAARLEAERIAREKAAAAAKAEADRVAALQTAAEKAAAEKAAASRPDVHNAAAEAARRTPAPPAPPAP